uniref:Uncharacterized protein n=1 Tax=Sphingobacterium sp. (strain 21) TaxID=743722 RepID=F4CD57_SPHS2
MQMRRRLPTAAMFIILLTIANGCKKVEPTVQTENGPGTQMNASISAVPIPTYPLDWENIAYMPTPTGSPSILVPWASGSNKQIAPEVVNDYARVDGWELVYNTFSTSILSNELYFILYNKYRGILKMFYYVPTNANFITSTNIVHKLGIEGTYANSASSPIMKFAASPIVDYDGKMNQASVLEPWQVARATWYAFEYELAYDANMANQSMATCNFLWPVTSNDVTKVTINGQISGTVNGSMSAPGVDLTVSPNFNSSSTGDGNIIIKGNSDVEKVKPSITTQLFNSLKNLVTKKLTGGLGGIVENLFSGIFGGKSGNTEDNVNLKINANVSLEGSLTSNFLVSSAALSIPGYNQSNTTGFVPAYNSPLGVFYISNKPIVVETEHIIPEEDPLGGGTGFGKSQFLYTIKSGSLNLQFNPAVLAIANIQNQKAEVIVNQTMYTQVGRLETIGDKNYFTGIRVGSDQYASTVVGIRVSFDVVPKNGSKKSKIVKTFKANMEHVTVVNPPGQEEW